MNESLAIACHIKNLSSQSFALGITYAVEFPVEFDLLVPFRKDTFQRYRVRMVWRKGDLVEGEFISPARLEHSPSTSQAGSWEGGRLSELLTD